MVILFQSVGKIYNAPMCSLWEPEISQKSGMASIGLWASNHSLLFKNGSINKL
jgi:hypothetical protein